MCIRDSMGTYLELNFHKPMENLTSADVKRILAPLLEFDKRSVTQIYTETLPPETQKAIAEKRAREGMDREQVLLAQMCIRDSAHSTRSPRGDPRLRSAGDP